MKQKLITVALFSGALFSVIAFSVTAYAETPLELEIVTPTRMTQPLDKTIADTTVLTEPEIRKSGAVDVPTLLRSLAGVEVVQSGGLGKISSIFMRGTNSSHVLILLDGVRINSATAGTTALEHIMLDSIERIEVVRGNVSSLYGSEAIGGVIQLFTKRGRGVPEFNASAGSDRLSFSLRTLTEPDLLAKAVALAARQIGEPTFPDAVWQRDQQKVIAALKEADTRPSTLAQRFNVP